ncbi:MAG: hypothetical protein K6L80_14745 [Agarilytica sp.]
MSIEKSAEGYTIRADKIFSQREFDLFAKISGDNNPIHVDPEFSAKAKFGRTVSHGMLLYTVIWGHIQRYFPKSIQLSQFLMFPAATYTDEAMEIELSATPSSKPNQLEIKGVMRRKADQVVTCESVSTIEYTGALPC